MLGTLAVGAICFAVGLITPRPAWVKVIQPIIWERLVSFVNLIRRK